MFWLVVLLIIGGLIWASNSNKKTQTPSDTEYQLRARNQEWANFIAAYAAVAKTKAEKQLVQRMLADIAAQNLSDPSLVTSFGQKGLIASAAQVVVEPEVLTAKPKLAVELDNTSLLLYFGAFLFVASVGLFIAFGGASGGLRTFAVLLVTAVMYGSGIWLFRHRPRLEQAALAFAGIGIVIAPLVGAAAYQYLFNKSHAPVVWLITSVLCMALYLHAMLVLRKPLINYVLIFTFLSLFESGVSVASAPVYYFGWGLAFVGIILQLIARSKNYLPELQESSRQSATVLLPVSLLAAIVLVPSQGALQLGVSLLLAAAFYGLETLNSKGSEQQSNAIAAQVTVIAGAATISYGITQNWLWVCGVVLTVNTLQAFALMAAKASRLWQNFASVLMLSSLAAVALALGHPAGLLAATALATVDAAIVWACQRRAEAYGLASIAWMALPYLYGQVLSTPRVSNTLQVALGLGALVLLLLTYLGQLAKSSKVEGWHDFARASYVIGAVSVLITSAFAGPVFCLVVGCSIALTMVILAEAEHNPDWAEGAALFLLVPLARSWDDKAAFLIATLVALGAFIVLSLRYRRELLRWGSTTVWLLLPLALGRGSIGSAWTPAEYAWAYMVAMLGLLFSRAVARGVLFVSGKVPLTSFARSASLSYVVGYVFAAALAVILSLFSGSSHLHTSLILAVLIVVSWLVSVFIEKRSDTLALLPVLAQALLLSLVRPHADGQHVTLYLLASIVLAAVSYWIALLMADENPHHPQLRDSARAALLMAFIAPGSVVFIGQSMWPMALGLLVAGCIVSYEVRANSQSDREWAGAIISGAIMWFLYVFGVHQLQAYVHVIIATLGLYAYWRAVRHQTEQSDNYLWAMLLVATIPLALQATSSQAGGVYGWWLLLEQVIIMLLGMAIRKRFVTMWGLYVSVGAVLYQLRNLGYAALALLALFLIGLAVYQLQKRTDLKS